jgi:hypothetical protein
MTIIVAICCFLLAFSINASSDEGDTYGYLKFHRVSEQCECLNSGSCVKISQIYDGYNNYGFDGSQCVFSDEQISMSGKNILRIALVRNKFSAAALNVYYLKLYFDSNTTLNEFSEKNIEKYFMISMNNDVIGVFKVIGVIENKFSLTIINADIDKLKSIIKSVNGNIVISED